LIAACRTYGRAVGTAHNRATTPSGQLTEHVISGSRRQTGPDLSKCRLHGSRNLADRAKFPSCTISIVIRLLRSAKFVDPLQNSVDPLSNEFSVQPLETAASLLSYDAALRAKNAIFAVFRQDRALFAESKARDAARDCDGTGAADLDQPERLHQCNKRAELLARPGQLEDKALGRRVDDARAENVRETQ